MNNKAIDKFSFFFSLFNKVVAGLLAFYTIGVGIYRGINSNTTSESITWVASGFLVALIIVFTFLAIDFSFLVWDRSTDWLSKHIRRFPYLRRWIIFPNVLFAFYAAYLVLKFLNADLTLRIFISVYLIWLLPAAITSLVHDDLSREHARLSKKVSREIRILNPQAAVQNAFMHFEDHLLKRLSGDSKLYSKRLIKAAYEGENSKLVFRSDSKDYTEDLFHLMSGAYAIFRNPRQHKIIEDDEQKAQALISLAELLIEFVDDSEERESKQEPIPQKLDTTL